MSRHPSPERPIFAAYQLCPPHLRRLVEDIVQSCDKAWLLSSIEKEYFDSDKACLAHLQLFALSKGFAVVIIISKADRF